MPVCYFVKSYYIKAVTGGYIISIDPLGGSGVDLAEIFRKAFPGTNAIRTKKPEIPAFPRLEQVTVTGGLPSPRIEDLNSFLDLIRNHITIKDDLDESHALSPHSLPPNSDYPDWRRTRLGDLINRAKDYNRQRPVADLSAANALVSELDGFISKHPRYQVADVIICAPSSDCTRTSDLPSYLGHRLATSLGKSFERAERMVDIPPQKDREESAINIQRNSMAVRSRLSGSRCILLDDLYESGATLQELGRVCRRAGAVEMLGLTVTKTAKYTQGMDVEKWPRG